MKPNQFTHPIRTAVRGVLFMAVLLSLFFGSGGVQTAQAITTGTISGTVYMSGGVLPITDASIPVQAQDTSGNAWSACTNPANGQYTITGIPLGRLVKVIADGSSMNISVPGCTYSTYGYQIWDHVTLWETATQIKLTLAHPSRTGISFTLADAVPYVEYLFFNWDNSINPNDILDELAVRQAIAYGTNRQAILEAAWGPNGIYGTPQNSYVADNAWGAATTSDGLTQYDYSQALAESTLTSAGWVYANPGDTYRSKGGQTLSLTLKTTDFSARQAGGALFVQQMHDIGIEVIPTYLSSSALFGSTGPLKTGNFDIAEFAYANCGSTEDKTCVPYSMFNTTDPGNYIHYSNSAADGYYAAAVAIDPTIPGNEALRRVQDINHQVEVMSDVPILPLFTRTTGSISGVIKKTDGTPLTGLKIRVDALDAATGDQVATACTNPANGYYTLAGMPAGTSVAVYATGGSGPDYCNSSSLFYGWSYWNESGDVSELGDATPILLTGIAPARASIDLTLGEAVPYIEYLVFNTGSSTNGILADKFVRQAIAYGTNRLYILDHAWLPNGLYGTVANSYVADNHWARVPDASLDLYPYNVAQAQSLLETQGWSVPGGSTDGIRYNVAGMRLSLTLKTTDAPVRQASVLLFVTQMQAIGIEVIPEYLGWQTFFGPTGPLATDTFDIAEYATGYCRNTLDETCVPFGMYHSGDEGNNAHYSSIAADAQYDGFEAAPDHADRQYHAFNHQVIAMEDLPYFPLFTRVTPLKIKGNAGVGGARLSWLDGTLRTVTASSTGAYSITVPFDWTGTVTPTKSGRVFTPASRSYTKLTSSRSSQNYTAKYIVTYRSTGSQDGWILESRETSGVGGKLNATDTTFLLGDDLAKKQYRAVLSFNTAGLPDTAVLQSAVLKIESSGPPSGTDPFTVLGKLRIDIANPFLGTGPALELVDFNAPPKLAGAAAFGALPSTGWYSASISKASSGAINRMGLTQFRLYFSLDDNNNSVADNMPFFSGNVLTTADRPTLTIIYTLP